jgi:hypothetical protein
VVAGVPLNRICSIKSRKDLARRSRNQNIQHSTSDIEHPIESPVRVPPVPSEPFLHAIFTMSEKIATPNDCSSKFIDLQVTKRLSIY